VVPRTGERRVETLLVRSYPMVSHARGVVGHATLGLTVGALLALLDQPA
jgi:hypothetical protein